VQPACLIDIQSQPKRSPVPLTLPPTPKTFPHFLQFTVGLSIILIVFSPSESYNWFNNFFGVIYATWLMYILTWFLQRMRLIPPWRLYLDISSSLFLSAFLGYAVLFLILLCNGGSYEWSAAKYISSFFFMSSSMAVLKLLSSRYPGYGGHIVLQIGLSGIFTGAWYEYSSTDYLKTGLSWVMCGLVGTIVAAGASKLILPTDNGDLVRSSLSGAVNNLADAVHILVEALTGDINPKTGKLAAATGVMCEDELSMDQGLRDNAGLNKLYNHAIASGMAMYESLNRLTAATQDIQIYRRQRFFQQRPFKLLIFLTRGALASISMVLQSLQTGSMVCYLINQHKKEFQAVSTSLPAALNHLADIVREPECVDAEKANAAVASLSDMENAFRQLVTAATGSNATLTRGVISLDMTVGLLFAVSSRVKKMYAALPEALGKDLSADAVQAIGDHFEKHPVYQFDQLAKRQLERTGSLNTEDLAKALLKLERETKHPDALSRKALLRRSLSQLPAIRFVPTPPLLPRKPRRKVYDWINAKTGITAIDMSYAAQMFVAYGILVCLFMIPAVNDAFDGKFSYALVLAIVLLEPSTGAVLLKSGLRVLGVISGLACGIISIYFAYLVNGLSWENTVQMDVALVASLAFFNFIAIYFYINIIPAKYGYIMLASCVVSSSTATTQWSLNNVAPTVAIYRALATLAGCLLEVLVCHLVFPVTSFRIFSNTTTTTLRQLALASEKGLNGMLLLAPQQLPPSAGDTSQRSGSYCGGTGGRSKMYTPSSSNPEKLIQMTLSPLRIKNKRKNKRGSLDSQTSHTASNNGAGTGVVRGSPQTTPLPTHQPLSPSTTITALSETLAYDDGRVVFISPSTPTSQSDEACISADTSYRSGRLPSLTSDVEQGVVLMSGEASLDTERRDRALILPGTLAHTPTKGTGKTGTVSGASPLSRADSGYSTDYVTIPGVNRQLHVLGPSMKRLLPTGIPAAQNILKLFQLESQLQYDYHPMRHGHLLHRFPVASARRVALLCRHMLNVLAAFGHVLDSHDDSASVVVLLRPYMDALKIIVKQQKEALQAMAAMVHGDLRMEDAWQVVTALDNNIQILFSRIMGEVNSSLLSGVHAVVGLSLVSMLLGLSYASRNLFVALIRAFQNEGEPLTASENEIMGGALRWSVDADSSDVEGQIISLVLGGPGGVEAEDSLMQTVATIGSEQGNA
jgi:hypothetical protein